MNDIRLLVSKKRYQFHEENDIDFHHLWNQNNRYAVILQIAPKLWDVVINKNDRFKQIPIKVPCALDQLPLRSAPHEGIDEQHDLPLFPLCQFFASLLIV
jgi:hypothetical protein